MAQASSWGAQGMHTQEPTLFCTHASFRRLITQWTPSSFQATYHAWHCLGGYAAVLATPMPELLGEMREELAPR